MSVLEKGRVSLVLAGEEVTLEPTVRAFSQLSAKWPHYSELLALLARNNVEAVRVVLRSGLGLKDAEMADLNRKMFETGLPPLCDACSDYVFRLFNGGKTDREVRAEQRAREQREQEEDEENPMGTAA